MSQTKEQSSRPPSGGEEEEQSRPPSGGEEEEEEQSRPPGGEEEEEQSRPPGGGEEEEEQSRPPSGGEEEEEQSRPPSGGEEEEQSRPPGGGEEEEQDTPLWALAPDTSFPEERASCSPHISSSPAQSLEELLSLDRISGTKVARLKASYKLLQDALKSAQETEIQLLGEAKRLHGELELLQGALESAEEQSTAEETDSEVTLLRQQLLRHYNFLSEREERQEDVHYQLESLQEEKLCLEREYEAQRKHGVAESVINALKESCEELRREVSQRRLEVRSLKEDLESRQKQTDKDQKDLDDKQDSIQFKQMELAQLLLVPNHLSKEIERMERKKTEVQKKVEALNEEIIELGRLSEEEEDRKHTLEKKKKSDYERRRAQREAGEREHHMLQRERDKLKENEAVLMQERGMLDIKLKHIMIDSKILYESQSKLLKEKDKQLKALKRMELSLKLAKERLEHTLALYNQTKAQRETPPKGDAGLQRRQTLQKEVDALTLSLLQQQQTVAEEEVHREQQEVEEELLKEAGRCREELHHLLLLTHIKAEERSQKERELIRAQLKWQHTKEELTGRDLVIKDRKRLNSDLQRRLSLYGKVSDAMKAERDRFVSLRSEVFKTVELMREDFKKLDADVELQRSIAIDKDRLLAKAGLKTQHSLVVRDILRKDISKVSSVVQELWERREEQKLEVVKLTHMINSREQALLHLRKRHDTVIQSRNERGVQLLEREEEACVFYEKVNIQEACLRKGREELLAMEEVLRALPTSLREETRQRDLRRNLLSTKIQQERESTTLKIQLSESNDRLLELGKALQDPTRLNRARELEGTDPSPEELIRKIEQLEVCLAQQEEQLLDKELLQEQVDRLTQRIRRKAENGRLNTLQYTKKMNELQSRDKQATRRLMAVVSELSMKQAGLMSVQRECKDKELQVDECLRRLDQGLAPCPQMEQDWMRDLRDHRRRQRDRLERERVLEEENMSLLPSGVSTTAEPRPSAYIPQNDTLPLPRPYGALAPFRPSEPGSSFRHIRKPQPKPLQIDIQI